VPGAGSVHSEQSFVVTADGARPLVPQDRSDPVRPGA
jgi:2-C-methyl-D-erythritol 4-phosphate cytidylyltransferase